MDDKLFSPTIDNGESKINPQSPDSIIKFIDADVEKQKIKKEAEKEERGLLGRLWGSIEHSSNNIAGLFIILLFLVGLLYTIWMLCVDSCDNHKKILEFWAMLTPLMTLALGYIFGRGQSE